MTTNGLTSLAYKAAGMRGRGFLWVGGASSLWVWFPLCGRGFVERGVVWVWWGGVYGLVVSRGHAPFPLLARFP